LPRLPLSSRTCSWPPLTASSLPASSWSRTAFLSVARHWRGLVCAVPSRSSTPSPCA
jgi:hypothetical protein